MRLSVSRLAVTLLVLATAALAQRAPLPGEAGHGAKPPLDARFGADGVRPEVTAAITASRSEADVLAREADLQSLGDRIPGLRLTTDPFVGTPIFLRSIHRFLTDPVPGAFTARGVTADFVSRHRGLFEIDPVEVETGRAVRDFVTRHNGLSHLTLQQEAAGLEIHGARLKANVAADGALVNISSTLLPRPADDFSWPDARIGARGALIRAAADVGIELTATPAPKGRATGTSRYQQWQPGADFRADVPVSTELLLYPRTRTRLHPAWMVVVPEPGVGNTYEVIVDAVDGSILLRGNRLRYFMGGNEDATYNVWVSDSPAPGSPGNATPDGTQFPVTARTLVTMGATPQSPQGWIPDGVNETLGNNVDAHLDLDGNPNVPDLPRPQGSPYRVFDFPVDLAMAPDTYQDAGVVQAFYYMNEAHDRLHALGFDEAAGNFQTDNFGLGGLGGDAISLDCQDGSGTNNANWNGDNADGTATRIQMYVFDAPDPDRDGGLDGELSYHEYAHGLSNRLVSDLNGFVDQPGAMGEGWSDFFAITLNAEPGDDPDATYGFSAYASKGWGGSDENYYWGLRRYPYTTDLSRSPLTFADTDPGQIEIPAGIPVHPYLAGISANEVHNAGEIWCSALLEVRSLLWNGGMGYAANEVTMQLVVDGMKLMPLSATYIDARDAILNADMVNNGGANSGAIWVGFAKRGMGIGAESPLIFNFSGTVEDFETPPLVSVSFPEGAPDQLVPELATVFPVEFVGMLGVNPIPGTATLHYSINGGPYATSAMTLTGTDTYDATLPPTACLDNVDWYVSVDTTSGGTVNVPQLAPAEGFSSTSFAEQAAFLDHDFEIASGWIIGALGDTASAGIWVRGDPNGTDAQPENDHTPLGTDCWFTGQGNVGGSAGSADVDGGTTSLVSPPIDLSSGDAEVSYWRWFDISEGGTPFTDSMTVEISNGGAWTTVETLGPAESPDTVGGWVFHEFLVSDHLTPNATVRLRFRASDTGFSSVVEAALDDVVVRRLSCESCQTDLGLSGPGDLTLSLCGPTMVSGASGQLQISGGPANGTVFLVLSLFSNPTPFYGGLLVPLPILAVFDFPTDASGSVIVNAPGGSGPLTVYLQAVALDALQPQGYELSQALEVFLGP